MFDFRDVGVLPESFASYTLGQVTDPFINSRGGGYLEWIDNRNKSSITRVGAVLKTTGDSTLGTSASTSSIRSTLTSLAGLDMHGIPKVRH